MRLRGRDLLDEIQLELTPAGGATAPTADKPLYTRWWLRTAAGAVLVGGAVAGALLAARDTRARDPNGGSTGDTLYVPSR